MICASGMKRYRASIIQNNAEFRFIEEGRCLKDQRQFELISRRIEKRFGKMKKGEEDAHAMTLFVMESNLLKVHRKNPKANSRRLKEAINLTLHKVNDYLETE